MTRASGDNGFGGYGDEGYSSGQDDTALDAHSAHTPPPGMAAEEPHRSTKVKDQVNKAVRDVILASNPAAIIASQKALATAQQALIDDMMQARGEMAEYIKADPTDAQARIDDMNAHYDALCKRGDNPGELAATASLYAAGDVLDKFDANLLTDSETKAEFEAQKALVESQNKLISSNFRRLDLSNDQAMERVVDTDIAEIDKEIQGFEAEVEKCKDAVQVLDKKGHVHSKDALDNSLGAMGGLDTEQIQAWEKFEGVTTIPSPHLAADRAAAHEAMASGSVVGAPVEAMPVMPGAPTVSTNPNLALDIQRAIAEAHDTFDKTKGKDYAGKVANAWVQERFNAEIKKGNLQDVNVGFYNGNPNAPSGSTENNLHKFEIDLAKMAQEGVKGTCMFVPRNMPDGTPCKDEWGMAIQDVIFFDGNGKATGCEIIHPEPPPTSIGDKTLAYLQSKEEIKFKRTTQALSVPTMSMSPELGAAQGHDLAAEPNAAALAASAAPSTTSTAPAPIPSASVDEAALAAAAAEQARKAALAASSAAEPVQTSVAPADVAATLAAGAPVDEAAEQARKAALAASSAAEPVQTSVAPADAAATLAAGAPVDEAALVPNSDAPVVASAEKNYEEMQNHADLMLQAIEEIRDNNPDAEIWTKQDGQDTDLYNDAKILHDAIKTQTSGDTASTNPEAQAQLRDGFDKLKGYLAELISSDGEVGKMAHNLVTIQEQDKYLELVGLDGISDAIREVAAREDPPSPDIDAPNLFADAVNREERDGTKHENAKAAEVARNKAAVAVEEAQQDVNAALGRDGRMDVESDGDADRIATTSQNLENAKEKAATRGPKARGDGDSLLQTIFEDQEISFDEINVHHKHGAGERRWSPDPLSPETGGRSPDSTHYYPGAEPVYDMASSDPQAGQGADVANPVAKNSGPAVAETAASAEPVYDMASSGDVGATTPQAGAHEPPPPPPPEAGHGTDVHGPSEAEISVVVDKGAEHGAAATTAQAGYGAPPLPPQEPVAPVISPTTDPAGYLEPVSGAGGAAITAEHHYEVIEDAPFVTSSHDKNVIRDGTVRDVAASIASAGAAESERRSSTSVEVGGTPTTNGRNAAEQQMLKAGEVATAGNKHVDQEAVKAAQGAVAKGREAFEGGAGGLHDDSRAKVATMLPPPLGTNTGFTQEHGSASRTPSPLAGKAAEQKKAEGQKK